MLEALQTVGGQTPLRVGWHGSYPSQAGGVVSSASCRFVLSAPRAPGRYFLAWFGADGVRGGAGTSGGGPASLVLQLFLLQLKWAPHTHFFFFLRTSLHVIS